MLNRFVTLLLVAMSMIWLPACTRGPMEAGVVSASEAAGERKLEDYRLGAGDKVRIIVFGEEQLTGEYFVSSAGLIAFPLVGEVQAGGKTLPELQQGVQTK